MSIKYTAVPLILALALGACSDGDYQQSYPNFKACYNDTGDANKCLQYIDENGRVNTQGANLSDSSYNQPVTTTSNSSDDGFDGSSALIGAAAGAAAGYGLGSNNSNNKAQNTRTIPTQPPAGNSTASGNSSKINTTKAPASKSSPTPTKSTTVRSGFGSTGSKSFGG